MQNNENVSEQNQQKNADMLEPMSLEKFLTTLEFVEK